MISTTDAKFMCINIQYFYQNTTLKPYTYLWLKLADILEEIITKYKLHDKVTADGYVFIKVRSAMYGLPQAGLLAQALLGK